MTHLLLTQHQKLDCPQSLTSGARGLQLFLLSGDNHLAALSSFDPAYAMVPGG